MGQARADEGPDPRAAVRAAAWLSMALLLAAAVSGLFASGGGLGSILHGIVVAVAVPVAFLGHLIALVACRIPPAASGRPG